MGLGLLGGLAALAGAGMMSGSKSFKNAVREKWKLDIFGVTHQSTMDVIDALEGIRCARNKDISFADTRVNGLLFADLVKKYQDEYRPNAYKCAVHDIAKKYCEEHDIPFTGYYPNTFHLPNQSGWYHPGY